MQFIKAELFFPLCVSLQLLNPFLWWSFCLKSHYCFGCLQRLMQLVITIYFCVHSTLLRSFSLICLCGNSSIKKDLVAIKGWRLLDKQVLFVEKENIWVEALEVQFCYWIVNIVSEYHEKRVLNCVVHRNVVQ